MCFHCKKLCHVYTLSSSVLLRQVVSCLNIKISCSRFATLGLDTPMKNASSDPISYLQDFCSCSCSCSTLSSSSSSQSRGNIGDDERLLWHVVHSVCVRMYLIYVWECLCVGECFPSLQESLQSVWVYADRVQSPLCAVDPTRSARSVWSVSLEGPCQSAAWGKKQTYNWQQYD